VADKLRRTESLGQYSRTSEQYDENKRRISWSTNTGYR